MIGAVWPHDNSIIALGFKRYGFAAEAARIARAISDAASDFQGNQLPELFAGIQENRTNFPVQYIGANVPQAWAASSAFALLQAILGIMQDAPNDRLYVDPSLQSWLPDITLTNLSIGKKTLSIRFWREGTTTRHQVLDGDPSHVEYRRFGAAIDCGTG